MAATTNVLLCCETYYSFPFTNTGDDHTLVADGSSGGSINTHHNHHLPTMLAGGSRLGIKHQGHIVKEDVRLGNLWSTIFDRMQVPLPKEFQCGEADGIVKDLV